MTATTSPTPTATEPIDCAPAREERRLQALRELELLDTDPEAAFDRLTELAQTLFDTPIALISLIDEHRQWFKSHLGLDAQETPIAQSFCRHAIEGTEVLVVPDARSDPRFSDNPLVTGTPNIRFYAGAPLILPNGLSLGTLCIIDREPREFTSEERRQLQAMAQIVVQEAELRSLRKRVARDFAARERHQHLDKARFLQTLGHELRTPLNAITGFSEVVLQGLAGPLNPRQTEYLTYIADGGKRLLKSIGQFMRYASLEFGALSIEPRPTDLNEVVGSVVACCRSEISARGLTVSLVAPGEDDMVASLEIGCIHEALREIVENAVRFSPDGGEVVIAIDASPNTISVRIVDRGPGMTADTIAMACVPFYQGESGPSRQYEGLGLGLAIAKGYIEANGGSITFESNEGEGTAVTVTLPRWSSACKTRPEAQLAMVG